MHFLVAVYYMKQLQQSILTKPLISTPFIEFYYHVPALSLSFLQEWRISVQEAGDTVEYFITNAYVSHYLLQNVTRGATYLINIGANNALAEVSRTVVHVAGRSEERNSVCFI